VDQCAADLVEVGAMGWFKDQYTELRSHAKWDLLKALMLSVLYPLFQKFRHLSWDWWVFAGLFVVTFVLLIVLEQERPRFQSNTQIAQNTADILIPATSTVVPGVPSPTFDAKTFFRTAYYSSVTAEVEKNMRSIAEQNEPNNREGFLMRFIGVGVVSYLHDYTWLTIYKSQLLMLLDMNGKNGWMPLTDAKNYFDKASAEYPQIYSKYSFEQWIAYMKQQQLILQHPSNMLEITVRGKDFLKYLTHWGRYSDARKG
jgi:hypothetical protein